LTAELRDKNYHKLAHNPLIKVVDGHASFADAHHVVANKVLYEGETIIIDTGSKAFVPPLPGIEGKGIYTSETLLEEKKLPKRLLIVGGGYIGLEFASMYLDFGSEVTMLQTEPTFLAREDEELASLIEKDFALRGLVLHKGVTTESFSTEKGEVTTTYQENGEEKSLISDAVLIATGRRPNVAGLALEKAGVSLTERGAVAVDEHLKTSQANIYAVGDVVGSLQFTYISLDDSRIVLSAMNGGARNNLNRGAVPYSVFISPAFSRIGLSEKDARAKFEVLVGEIPAASIPKALILGEPRGLLKVIVDKKGHLILGAHLYCAESYEMIN
jgi:pyruvate/2-oxoglutarate dehydrogenase complex dihydrolipoamide dehydrogenase (E3) component